MSDTIFQQWKYTKQKLQIFLNIGFKFYFSVCKRGSGGGGSVAKSCPILANPWTIAHQAPLSMRFSRQEYWSGLPFPTQWNLLNPGIELTCPALTGGFFNTEPLGKILYCLLGVGNQYQVVC